MKWIIYNVHKTPRRKRSMRRKRRGRRRRKGSRMRKRGAQSMTVTLIYM